MKFKTEVKEFELAPEGVHVARCISIIDRGTHYDEKWEKWQRKIMVSWELPTELLDDGRPMIVRQMFPASMHEKSRLRQSMEAWLGKRFTEETADAFDIESMLDKTCMLQIVHSPDGKWANVNSIMPLPKGQKCPARVNDLVFFDTENPDVKLLEGFADSLQEVIRTSEEFKRFEGDTSQVEQWNRAGARSAGAAATAAADFDDDIPF